jgi:mono/diheme cytochrome c family protein
MRRFTLAIVVVVWVDTVLVSAQSSVSTFHRLLDLMGLRPVPSVVEQNRATVPVPRTWDDQAVASLQLPLAVAAASPIQVPSTYYYGIPVRPIYKSYAVYHPSKEPPGYIEWLERQSPQIALDTATLKTFDDWIAAGERVFDAPITYGHLGSFGSDLYLRDPGWYEDTRAPLARDGTLPFYRYVIRTKGKIEIGIFSCGMCHTRVMPDGTLVKGAQGNFQLGRALAWDMKQQSIFLAPLNNFLGRRFQHLLYSAPWIEPDAYPGIDELSAAEIAAHHAAIPPGVMARHGTSPLVPAKVPDLIGVQERRYLDATGLVRHREIGDLMRYAALNQDADGLARYGDFAPREAVPFLVGKAPADPAKLDSGRYSDEQLYALALYIYSLKPPPNPHPFDALAARGRQVFERERCVSCHTPPLYTSNQLTPAVGFTPPAADLARYDVLNVSVRTDPALATKTRRGTGYYKVPSLKGVWYRGPFEHSGSVATLEDWFDPNRLRDDYVPTGFKRYGVKTHAVKGHEFGLRLPADDKRALIAFLRTL